MATILGGASIENASIISSVTSDLTGIIAEHDESGNVTRILGYRGPTKVTTDLTSMFQAIATGSLDVSWEGPIPAFRGADVPAESEK